MSRIFWPNVESSSLMKRFGYGVRSSVRTMPENCNGVRAVSAITGRWTRFSFESTANNSISGVPWIRELAREMSKSGLPG